MSDIRRTLKMSFNDEYVGTVSLWDDGDVTAEFTETTMGAACITFLVSYALRQMLADEGAFAEFQINLN